MTALYRFDPAQGRFTVQAFATGMLSMLGHSPTFAVRDYAGTVRLDGDRLEGLSVALTIRVDSLDLLDRVSASDRAEILGRMQREVLETAAFPEVAFHTVETESEPLDRGHYRTFLGGRLTLHGATGRQGIDAELLVFTDGLRLRGGGTVRMSAYGIKAVTALGGAIRLKDELRFSFDLAAIPEGP